MPAQQNRRANLSVWDAAGNSVVASRLTRSEAASCAMERGCGGWSVRSTDGSRWELSCGQHAEATGFAVCGFSARAAGPALLALASTRAAWGACTIMTDSDARQMEASSVS